jgi:hypothetical protein
MTVQSYSIGSAGTLELDVDVVVPDGSEELIAHIVAALQTATQEMTGLVGVSLDDYASMYEDVEMELVHYVQSFSAVYGDISLSYSLTFDLVTDPSIMVMGVMMELADYIDQSVRHEVAVHLSGEKFCIHYLEHQSTDIHAFAVDLDDESGELRLTPVM